MRKWLAVVGCCCLATIAVFVLKPSDKSNRPEPGVPENPVQHPTSNSIQASRLRSDAPAPTPTQAIALTTTSAPATASDSAAPIPATPVIEPSTEDSDATNLPPTVVMENMRSAIRNYGSRLGGNPVGTNPEITAALTGANPKQVTFIKPGTGLRINSRGELIDSWGTPFFFHQLSASETEIHSAGPDKQMWTGDDLVMK